MELLEHNGKIINRNKYLELLDIARMKYERDLFDAGYGPRARRQALQEWDRGRDLIASGRMTFSPDGRLTAHDGSWVNAVDGDDYVGMSTKYMKDTFDSMVSSLKSFKDQSIEDFIKNTFYGGVDPDETARQKINAAWEKSGYLSLADAMDVYRKAHLNDNFEGSIFTDSNDFNSRMSNFIKNLRDGEVNDDDAVSATALGLNWNNFINKPQETAETADAAAVTEQQATDANQTAEAVQDAAQQGAEAATAAEENADVSSEPQLTPEEAAAVANGADLDEIKRGNQLASETKWRPEEWIRFGNLINDASSILTSYIPVYGTAIAGVQGLASVGADLVADAMDKNVSWGQVAGNAAMNLGMAGLGMIPGGAGKVGKVFKNFKKLLPAALSTIGGISAISDPEIQKSFSKILSTDDADKLTNNDWKNIIHGAKMIAFMHNSNKAAAQSYNETLRNTKGVLGAPAKALRVWGESSYDDLGALKPSQFGQFSKVHDNSINTKLIRLKSLRDIPTPKSTTTTETTSTTPSLIKGILGGKEVELSKNDLNTLESAAKRGKTPEERLKNVNEAWAKLVTSGKVKATNGESLLTGETSTPLKLSLPELEAAKIEGDEAKTSEAIAELLKKELTLEGNKKKTISEADVEKLLKVYNETTGTHSDKLAKMQEKFGEMFQDKTEGAPIELNFTAEDFSPKGMKNYKNLFRNKIPEELKTLIESGKEEKPGLYSKAKGLLTEDFIDRSGRSKFRGNSSAAKSNRELYLKALKLEQAFKDKNSVNKWLGDKFTNNYFYGQGITGLKGSDEEKYIKTLVERNLRDEENSRYLGKGQTRVAKKAKDWSETEEGKAAIKTYEETTGKTLDLNHKYADLELIKLYKRNQIESLKSDQATRAKALKKAKDIKERTEKRAAEKSSHISENAAEYRRRLNLGESDAEHITPDMHNYLSDLFVKPIKEANPDRKFTEDEEYHIILKGIERARKLTNNKRQGRRSAENIFWDEHAPVNESGINVFGFTRDDYARLRRPSTGKISLVDRLQSKIAELESKIESETDKVKKDGLTKKRDKLSEKLNKLYEEIGTHQEGYGTTPGSPYEGENPIKAYEKPNPKPAKKTTLESTTGKRKKKTDSYHYTNVIENSKGEKIVGLRGDEEEAFLHEIISIANNGGKKGDIKVKKVDYETAKNLGLKVSKGKFHGGYLVTKGKNGKPTLHWYLKGGSINQLRKYMMGGSANEILEAKQIPIDIKKLEEVGFKKGLNDNSKYDYKLSPHKYKKGARGSEVKKKAWKKFIDSVKPIDGDILFSNIAPFSTYIDSVKTNKKNRKIMQTPAAFKQTYQTNPRITGSLEADLEGDRQSAKLNSVALQNRGANATKNYLYAMDAAIKGEEVKNKYKNIDSERRRETAEEAYKEQVANLDRRTENANDNFLAGYNALMANKGLDAGLNQQLYANRVNLIGELLNKAEARKQYKQNLALLKLTLEQPDYLENADYKKAYSDWNKAYLNNDTDAQSEAELAMNKITKNLQLAYLNDQADIAMSYLKSGGDIGVKKAKIKQKDKELFLKSLKASNDDTTKRQLHLSKSIQKFILNALQSK